MSARRAKHAARPRRRTKGQLAVIALNATACVVSLALAATITWSWQRVREIPRIELSTALAGDDEGAGATGQAQNFLIVGSDSADGLPDDDPVRVGRDGGLRTDTLMVVRVDPAEERAALLSLPRDLYVPIAGTGRSSRINNAIQGGPARLIATINDALDIPIHHYVELDFQGFKDLVDAVGGVPVFFDRPARDRASGLWVPEAGCTTLDPDQALAYARSRTFELQDERGRWHTDGTGDLGRISRQQDFIRRALRRAFQRGARNPRVLAELVEVGTHAVTLDRDLTPADLISLGNRFRNFDPSTLATYSLPVFDEVIGGAQVLRLDTRRAQPVLDLFRGADPDRVAPDNTVVLVQNGTPDTGRGADAAVALRELGFVVPPDNVVEADSFDVPATTVLYLPGHEAQAGLVARALAGDVVVEETNYIVGADVNVIIGADWPGVGEELRDTAAGLPPTTATTTPATPPSSSSTASTVLDGTAGPSTPVGEVPGPPPGAGC